MLIYSSYKEKMPIKNLIKNTLDYMSRIKKSKMYLLFLVYAIYNLTAAPHAVYDLQLVCSELNNRPKYQQANYDSLLEEWCKLKNSGEYLAMKNYWKDGSTIRFEARFDNMFNTMHIKTPSQTELVYGYVTMKLRNFFNVDAEPYFDFLLFIPHLIGCILLIIMVIAVILTFNNQTIWSRWSVHIGLFIIFLLLIKILDIVEFAYYMRTLALMDTIDKNDSCLEALAFELTRVQRATDRYHEWLSTQIN